MLLAYAFPVAGLIEMYKRNVVVLTLLALFRGFGVGGYVLLYSVYLDSLGYSMAGIGLAITVASAAAAAIGPAFGALLDTVGTKVAVAATSLLPALALLLLGLEPAYPLLVASYMLHMLGFMLGQPARMSMLYRSVGLGELGWYASITLMGFGVARAMGSLLAPTLVETLGWRLAFTVLGLVVLTGVAVFTAAAREPSSSRRRPSLVDIAGAYARAVKPDRRLATLYLLLAVDRIGWSLWFPMLSALLHRMGYGLAYVGSIVALMSMIQTLASPATGKLTDRLSPVAVLIASEAAGVAGVAMLAYNQPLYALILVGLSVAAWVPAYNKLVAAHRPTRPGEAYATANTVRIASSSIAPYIGGAIHDSAGAGAVMAVSALLLTVAAALAPLSSPQREFS